MKDYFGSKATKLSNLLELPIGPNNKKYVNDKLVKIGRSPLFVNYIKTHTLIRNILNLLGKIAL